MAENSPVRIDRAALERIIQRATELQTAERDIGDNLTSDEVMALGAEVGIPGRYLQQALLEERTRLVIASPSGLTERLTGPAEVSAQRVVRGEQDAIEQHLVRWLEQNELFVVQRHQPGRIAWEPVGGLHAAIRRATAAAGGAKRPMMLARADTLAATVGGLEPGYCHVSLTATARKARGEALGGGAAFATAGLAGASILVALGAFLPLALLPAPVAFAAGVGMLRRYRPVVSRIQLGLERALDQLEQGGGRGHRLPPPQPSIMDLLAERGTEGVEVLIRCHSEPWCHPERSEGSCPRVPGPASKIPRFASWRALCPLPESACSDAVSWGAGLLRRRRWPAAPPSCET